jgi:hypothetical protein
MPKVRPGLVFHFKMQHAGNLGKTFTNTLGGIMIA